MCLSRFQILLMNFSVIIPCHNAEATILQCLRSAAGQSLPPYEIIVVNDASSDSSRQIIESCNIPLCLVNASMESAAGARNAGIEAARGHWLAFLDADDVWYRDHLNRATQLIRKHQVVGYLNHYDRLSVDGQHVTHKRCRNDSVVTGFGRNDYVKLYSRYRHFVGMSACIVEREAAGRVGAFDESMARTEDLEFWLRVIKGQPWLFDPVASSAYRKNVPNSLSSNKVSAALYRLIAFVKNREDSPAFSALIRRQALRALLKAIVAGDEKDRSRAYEVAYRELSGAQKVLLRVVRRTPALVRLLTETRWL